MKYNFSIIIPHRNISQLLERNLVTIPKRNDIQIIVIDDNSNKIHLERLKKLQAFFTYVDFLFLPECKGGGYARNIGLQYASGRYILFSDADDFFLPSISSILDDYQACDADIIYFDAISVDTDSYKFKYRTRHLNLMHNQYAKNPIAAEKRLRYEFGEPWCKLIKKEIICRHQIFFDECVVHNDTKFSYLVGFHCKTCIVDKRAVYCVTDRQGSVSKGNTEEKLYVRTKVFAEANKFFKSHNIDLFEERAMRPMMNYLINLKLDKYRNCKKILLNCGMSNRDILFKELLYPYLIGKKMLTNFQEYICLFSNIIKY